MDEQNRCQVGPTILLDSPILASLCLTRQIVDRRLKRPRKVPSSHTCPWSHSLCILGFSTVHDVEPNQLEIARTATSEKLPGTAFSTVVLSRA